MVEEPKVECFHIWPLWSWSSRVWVGLCPLDTTKASFSRKTRFWGCFLVLKAPTNLKLWVFDTVQTKPRMNIRYTDSHRFANIPMWLTESFSRVTKCNQTGKASFSLKNVSEAFFSFETNQNCQYSTPYRLKLGWTPKVKQYTSVWWVNTGTRFSCRHPS